MLRWLWFDWSCLACSVSSTKQSSSTDNLVTGARCRASVVEGDTQYNVRPITYWLSNILRVDRLECLGSTQLPLNDPVRWEVTIYWVWGMYSAGGASLYTTGAWLCLWECSCLRPSIGFHRTALSTAHASHSRPCDTSWPHVPTSSAAWALLGPTIGKTRKRSRKNEETVENEGESNGK